jgi:cytosine/adenosine deaminase-related metal-dependent hydrolase
MDKVFRARWILPICYPPIQNGWVAVRGHEVIAIGAGDCPANSLQVDLGSVALLPGLVNAHTHLEFSDLAGPIGMPGVKLYDWIDLVIKSRRDRLDGCEVIDRGATGVVLGGARLVGEIATVPWPGFFVPPQLEMLVFGEVLGLRKPRADERLSAAAGHFSRFSGHAQVTPAVSPHAPYSTSLETLMRCVAFACERQAIVAMHVAESKEERELIESGTGPFADQLAKLGFFQPDCFGKGPEATLQILRELSKAPAALVVHGNDLKESEIEFLAGQPQMTVVYCPRTHVFFKHPVHPVAPLVQRGVRVALGTDSLASNPDLSIWNEVRWMLQYRPDIAWHDSLSMATIHGADALGRSDLGRIVPGAKCGLVSVAGDVDRCEDLPSRWIESPEPPIWVTE